MTVMKRLLFGTVMLALSASGAAAEEVLLTLTGAVTGGQVELTQADLDELEWHEIATSTTVTDGQPVFRGVLMRDILDRAQASGDTVTARALNDYVID